MASEFLNQHQLPPPRDAGRYLAKNIVNTVGCNFLVVTFAFAISFAVAQDLKPSADGRAVTFVDYRETGKWKTWTDGRLSVRIPDEWHVAIDVPETDQKPPKTEWQYAHDAKWVYRFISEDGERVVLSIVVYSGGPEYVECFCAPKDVYEYLEKDGTKIWALTIPGLDARLFKLATKTLRLDIHGKLPKKKPERIRYVIESAKLIEPKSDIAK